MNGLAFLVMLAAFGAVLGWYVLNHERDADGREGLLGIRTAADEPRARRGPLFARRPGGQLGDPAARVRARAAAARAASEETEKTGLRQAPDDA